MTEISRLEIIRESVKITHAWRIDSYGRSDTEMYSKSFFNKALPGVKFHIFYGITSINYSSLIILKTPSEPAKVTVDIYINDVKRRREKFEHWEDKCIISEELIKNSNCVKRNEYICEIIWHGFNNPKSSSVDLCGHLEHFLTTPDFSDLVLKIDNNEIPVHKVILAAYSPVFSAMLKAGMTETKENEIVVKDIEFDIMKKVIEFMYSGKIDSKLSVDDLLSMLQVGDKYEIMDLKKSCGEILVFKISIHNVFQICEYANLYQTTHLIAKVLLFMKANKNILIKSQDFKTFLFTNPKLLSDFIIETIAECSK